MMSTARKNAKTGDTQQRVNVTPAQFQAQLEAADQTVADWARAHQQPLQVVYKLLQGRIKGSRGTARRVARAMGLALPSIERAA